MNRDIEKEAVDVGEGSGLKAGVDRDREPNVKAKVWVMKRQQMMSMR